MRFSMLSKLSLSIFSLSFLASSLFLFVLPPAATAHATASEMPTGVVTGAVSYPSEVLPADLEVCAHPEGSAQRAMVCTRTFVADSSSASGVGYRLRLPEGRYEVFARTEQLPNVRAYALSPRRDGAMVPMQAAVRPGEVTSGVDANGWYTYPYV